MSSAQRSRQVVSVVVLLAPCLLASPPLSAAECRCQGPWQFHFLSSHTFETSSCSYPKFTSDGGIHYVYETCVANHDGDLDFKWYVPGPASWIPSGVILPSPRLRSERNSLEWQSGCLRYGNLAQAHDAEFLPHAKDAPKLQVEDMVGCNGMIRLEATGQASSASRAQRGVDAIFSIEGQLLRVFAPTDRARVNATMLRIDAIVDVQYDAESYSHAMTVSAAPQGEVFQPDQVRLVPELEEIRSAYEDYAEGGRLPISGEEQTYRITRPVPVEPRLEDVRYNVVAGDDDTVATLLVPFWR